MKGEYVEQHVPNNETPTMFSKLPQQQQQQQSQQPQHHSFSHNPFQLSGEDDNRNSGGATPITVQKPNSSGDGATIEVVRRPRGRPPGSKNKPKPPVIITRDPEPTMSPYILEVSGGNDVVEAIARFSRRKNMGLCILTGSGTVVNVTLRQPSTTPGATVTFHGRFDILSVSATFLPQQSGASPMGPNGFSISLAGPQGQIIGGIVAGELMAAGTVFVIAASFNDPSYHRLPPEEEARNSVSGGDGHSPPVSGGGGGESGHGPAESCGMSMYSCHLPLDVIWAPTARPPPPPPY
ncbi:AT-hook motif nuclear-localized protein 17 [Gastrolobium bilobum]|uniref:AT-hook motif nuclear-localized protein 17 n=1 Tax=Gastrolobium bilobum TaxID=150636 RepID=UPI002AB0958C|nr:AT-hook motif nuclear-localized protein 17 [Gastrolobium bilobum]